MKNAICIGNDTSAAVKELECFKAESEQCFKAESKRNIDIKARLCESVTLLHS